MVNKQLQVLLCIFATLLLFTSCNAKQKTPENTATPEITEMISTESIQTNIVSETEFQYIPEDMELPVEEEAPSVDYTSATEKVPEVTSETETTSTPTTPATTEVTEAPNPYGNGPNSTMDDAL